MRMTTICRLLLLGVFVTIVAATLTAQDAPPGVRTKAELEQLVAKLRSGELKGEVLFKEGERYSVDTSYFHQTKKQKAQSHAETDEVFLVLSGAAQLTLGGELTDKFLDKGQKGELRGTGIKGGTVRQVAQGDVVNIPRGTSHHVDPGEGHIVYMVVKIHGK